MKKKILVSLLAFAATAFLSGCASMPRELADHKLIPGGEYTGEAENKRPEEIKYQPLPDHVQYVRASDSLVIAVYNDLQKILASDEDQMNIAKYLFLMPGTWESIQEAPELQSKFKRQKDKYKVGVGDEKFTFRYAIPKDAKSARKAWGVAKRMIRYPGWSPDAVIPDPNAPAPETAPEAPAETAQETAAVDSSTAPATEAQEAPVAETQEAAANTTAAAEAPAETAQAEAAEAPVENEAEATAETPAESAPAENVAENAPAENAPAPVATIPMPKPAPAEIKIRAISTAEMDALSKFSPFKMVEPLFVVNDKFLLGYNKKGELEVLDEIPYYLPFFEQFKKIMNGEE